MGLWIVCRRAADSVSIAGEKGSCDLFPTSVQTRSTGAGLFRGKFGFCGCGRGTRAVRTKTQLAQYKTKKQGYARWGKKRVRMRFGIWFR